MLTAALVQDSWGTKKSPNGVFAGEGNGGRRDLGINMEIFM